MLINYDRNPRLTIDGKLQSLIESIQTAINELRSDHYTKAEVDKLIAEIRAEIEE